MHRRLPLERSSARVRRRAARGPGRGKALSSAWLGAASAVVIGAAGCASGAPPSAAQNHVFYQDTETVGPGAPAIEAAYPRLDAPASGDAPEYIGVSLFGGEVHLSRPRSWRIRSAGTAPGRRFVVYVSPRAYLFAVYERGDQSASAWRAELTGYEEHLPKEGAQLLRHGVPMAVADAQGRSYLVKRSVPAAKGPLVTFSNEYLIRGERGIALVQIVRHEEELGPVAGELRRVLETMGVE